MELSFTVVLVIFGARTFMSVLYLGVGSGTVSSGVLGCNIKFSASIWRTVPCFLVSVAWVYIVCVVVMYVGMSGLIYRVVRSGTVAPGVSGNDIEKPMSIWRTGSWFLVELAWIHCVWVVVVDVGVLGMMLVWLG